MVPRSPLILALALAALGCTEWTPPPVTVDSYTLAGPPEGWSVYEPHVAFAPDGGVRVAGQYGPGYNRGGVRFWTAVSDRGRSTWLEEEVVPDAPVLEPTMAADATVAIGPDGAHYLFGLWADSRRAGVPDASLVLSAADPIGGSLRRRRTLAVVTETEPGVLAASDKPWMIVDPDTSSSPQGTLYFAWTALTVHLSRDPPSIERTLVVSSSRDGGYTVSPPIEVAREGMGAQLAVRSDGTLDVIWTELRGQGRLPSKRLLHVWSRDGGVTFSLPRAVATLDEDGPDWLGHGALAAGPGGALHACWPQGRGDSASTRVICNHFTKETRWGIPTPVTTAGGFLSAAYPALTFGAGSWWLAIYAAREDTLSVQLLRRHRATGSWETGPVLASAPLDFPRFCAAPDLPCRRDPSMFTPGDYVSAAGSGTGAAFAYVLPGSGLDDQGRDGSLRVSIVRTDPDPLP